MLDLEAIGMALFGTGFVGVYLWAVLTPSNAKIPTVVIAAIIMGLFLLVCAMK